MALKWLLANLGVCLRVTLVILSLTLISIGIGMIYSPAGWIAGGIAGFLLEYRFDLARKEI